MERMVILIPTGESDTKARGFDVFGDGGSGSIDYTAALNSEPIRVWSGDPPRGGHLREGHLRAGHLGRSGLDGHLTERFLGGRHLRPAADASFETAPYSFGRFQHAVVMRDEAGNASSGSATVVTRSVNSEPGRMTRERLTEYDAGTDRVTVEFVRAEDVG